MIQTVLLNQVLKVLLNSNVIKDLIRYKDEPNDADKKCLELEQIVTDHGFKINALETIIKDMQDE